MMIRPMKSCDQSGNEDDVAAAVINDSDKNDSEENLAIYPCDISAR